MSLDGHRFKLQLVWSAEKMQPQGSNCSFPLLPVRKCAFKDIQHWKNKANH